MTPAPRRRSRRSRRLLAAALLVVAAGGCSADAAKRAGYETLHNVSDQQNDGDPRYDPGPRPSYDVYRDQREQVLRPAPGPPLVPVSPPPAGGAVK
jgi:hypothetical protein